MSNRHHEASVVIARSPEEVYDMVSDVTRMGAWSPVCKASWWDEGDGPRVGAHFTGRNEMGDRVWEMQCEVVAADRPNEFAWVTMTGTRWGYAFRSVDGGTEVTESWEFTPKTEAIFKERFGDDAENQVQNRYETAQAGIPATLAAIKQSAETDGA
jgi:uncharacterized protein YndB with AHSA1/START domain